MPPSFADTGKFPAGSKITVSMVDIGVKYYNPYEETSYLPYTKTLPSVTYEIEEPTERVYVQAKYTAKQKNPETGVMEYVWNGYTSDHQIDIGGPGFEHRQEYTVGSFLIGNRGTGDSVPKHVTLEYDVHNTGYIGVTTQYLLRNLSVAGVNDSVVTNLQYKLWDSKTNTVTDWMSYNGEIPQPLVITDFTNEEGVYLKGFQYDIDTVPALTVLGTSANNSDNAFSYYGVCLNRNSIGIEMCVRKRSTKTLSATDRDWYFENATINATVELALASIGLIDVTCNHDAARVIVVIDSDVKVAHDAAVIRDVLDVQARSVQARIS